MAEGDLDAVQGADKDLEPASLSRAQMLAQTRFRGFFDLAGLTHLASLQNRVRRLSPPRIRDMSLNPA